MVKLYIKCGAGMGNRLQGLLGALAIAEKYKFLPVIDWSDDYYSEGGENSFSRFFQLRVLTNHNYEEGDERCVYPVRWAGLLRESEPNLRDVRGIKACDRFHSLSKLVGLRRNASALVYTGHGFERKSLWRHGIFSSAHSLFHRHLRPSNELLLMLQDLPNVAQCVGVHIRGTDLGVKFQLVDFINAIGRDDTSVLLCTDSSRVEEEFRVIFRGSVVTLDKWFPLNGHALHVPQAGADSRSPTLVGFEALRDMYALSQCKYVVGTRNSTFSKLAARIVPQKRRRLRLVGRV